MDSGLCLWPDIPSTFWPWPSWISVTDIGGKGGIGNSKDPKSVISSNRRRNASGIIGSTRASFLFYLNPIPFNSKIVFLFILLTVLRTFETNVTQPKTMNVSLAPEHRIWHLKDCNNTTTYTHLYKRVSPSVRFSITEIDKSDRIWQIRRSSNEVFFGSKA